MTDTKAQNALAYCDQTISSFEKKAKHNKDESLWCFRIVMTFTLLAPLFVTLGEGLTWGKVIPSVLSVGAAFATAWLQLRKPQQLWALYRTCQRELEDHRAKFQFRIEQYGETDNPEALLAQNVAEIALDAHYKWIPIAPNPESLQEVQAPEIK